MVSWRAGDKGNTKGKILDVDQEKCDRTREKQKMGSEASLINKEKRPFKSMG